MKLFIFNFTLFAFFLILTGCFESKYETHPIYVNSNSSQNNTDNQPSDQTNQIDDSSNATHQNTQTKFHLKAQNDCRSSEEAFRKLLISKLEKIYLERIESFDRDDYMIMRPLLAESSIAPVADVQNSESKNTTNTESSPENVTGTNNQVENIDEADFVKNDGNYIYHLSQNSNSSQLKILKSWPADQTQIISSISVKGQTLAMSLSKNKLYIVSMIVSNYYPKSVSGSEPSLGKAERIDSAIAPPFYQTNKIALSIINIEDRYRPQIENIYSFQGNYVGMRFFDESIRLVIKDYRLFPDQIKTEINRWDNNGRKKTKNAYIKELDKQFELNKKIISDLNLTDFFRSESFVKESLKENMTPQNQLNQCESVYLPNFDTENGYVSVVTLNTINNKIHQNYILAGTDDIYMAEKSLYLANRIGYWSLNENDTNKTVIHKFELTDSDSSSYTSSGVVPGHILNQFSLDEYDDILRVAVTIEEYENIKNDGNKVIWWWGRNVKRHNRVFTLKQNQSHLEIIGKTEALADGESIYSVRFWGERGFVVTFLRVDPLYTIDLKDPTQPTVLGELKVPGFSSYIHMLDEQHLLTAGSEADENGRVTGVKVSIFDVSDMKNPVEVKSELLGKGWSEASWDHKAFTYYAHKNILALPINTYENVCTYQLQPNTQMREQICSNKHSSELRLFYVSTTEIEPMGHLSLDRSKKHDQFRRSIFADNYVYGIASFQIQVAPIDDLSRYKVILLDSK